MYIAFRWLVALSMAMWIAMCFLDIYKPRNGRYGYISEMPEYGFKPPPPRNRTIRYSNWDQNLEKDTRNNFRVEQGSIFIQYLIFGAGALVVLILHRTQDIILYTKGKITKIDVFGKTKAIAAQNHLKKLAAKIGIAYRKNIIFWLRIFKKFWASLINFYTHLIFENIIKNQLQNIHTQATETKFIANIVVPTKVNETVSKANAQPMITDTETETIQESTENVSSARKEIIHKAAEHFNQLRQNNNLHHLYVITRHENIFLKNRLKKICQEKNQIERNLVILLNEVYCSKNTKLKSLCSKFTVNTKNNLLHSNVEKELKKFLETSRQCDQASSSKDGLVHSVDSDLELYNETKEKGETGDYPNFRHVSSDVVWTVKGRDGIIEKLYEYSIMPPHSGETVRRIREYSVYFEKDRIINGSITNADFTDLPAKDTSQNHTHCCQSIRNRKFLTESPAFKKFLLENKRLPALME